MYIGSYCSLPLLVLVMLSDVWRSYVPTSANFKYLYNALSSSDPVSKGACAMLKLHHPILVLCNRQEFDLDALATSHILYF